MQTPVDVGRIARAVPRSATGGTGPLPPCGSQRGANSRGAAQDLAMAVFGSESRGPTRSFDASAVGLALEHALALPQLRSDPGPVQAARETGSHRPARTTRSRAAGSVDANPAPRASRFAPALPAGDVPQRVTWQQRGLRSRSLARLSASSRSTGRRRARNPASIASSSDSRPAARWIWS